MRLKSFQSFFKLPKEKKFIVSSAGIQLLLKEELSSMRIFRRVTLGSREVTSISLGAPSSLSYSPRKLENILTCA